MNWAVPTKAKAVISSVLVQYSDIFLGSLKHQAQMDPIEADNAATAKIPIATAVTVDVATTQANVKPIVATLSVVEAIKAALFT